MAPSQSPGSLLMHLHGEYVGRGRNQWGRRKLLRTKSAPAEFESDITAVDTPLPSKAVGGNPLVRAVVGLLSKSKGGKVKSRDSNANTEPASPVSAPLSRTNSSSSSHHAREDSDQSMQQGERSRHRVSFDVETVTEVFIEKMNEVEASKTFYCRAEYTAFKDAYRMHRFTSTDWSRGTDCLPCNCEACRDDLEDVHMFPPPDDNYDSSFDDPEPTLDSRGPDSAEEGDNASADKESTKEGLEQQENKKEPLFPVGSICVDDQGENRVSNASDKGGGSLSPCYVRHRRRCTWGGKNTPPPAKAVDYGHKRGESFGGSYSQCESMGVSIGVRSENLNSGSLSLDDSGVKASVREAVRCHGVGYAYKTLRMQGFSDLYIRANLLPEGIPNGRYR